MIAHMYSLHRKYFRQSQVLKIKGSRGKVLGPFHTRPSSKLAPLPQGSQEIYEIKCANFLTSTVSHRPKQK